MFGSSVFKKDGIEIEERMNYPYENTVDLNIKTLKTFLLCLRLPKWNEGYTVQKDGKPIKCKIKNGFVEVPIENDCSIEYRIKCKIVKHKNRTCVWFSKGAMVYTHKVRSLWKTDYGDERSSKDFPSYNIYPSG